MERAASRGPRSRVRSIALSPMKYGSLMLANSFSARSDTVTPITVAWQRSVAKHQPLDAGSFGICR